MTSKITFSNVKLAWFPPNAMTVLQRMDMGVIYTFNSRLQEKSYTIIDNKYQRNQQRLHFGKIYISDHTKCC